MPPNKALEPTSGAAQLALCKLARVRDLAKGLVAHFESEPELVGPLRRDYEFLAERVVEALKP